MNQTAIFIQPLLSANETWGGFLVESSQSATDEAAAVQSLIARGVEMFDKRLPWYVPPTFISIPTSISPNVVPLLPLRNKADQTVEPSEQETLFRQSKQELGLLTQVGIKLPSSGEWDHLLISCAHARSLPPYTLTALSVKTQIIAIGTTTLEERLWSLKNGCKMTTAEYLAYPHIEEKKADINRMRLLELLALIVADADTPQLEAILRQEAKLSYSLLRLVNSAAIAPRSPITSFSQAINLLGRRQLQRWLQLLVYADSGNHHINPLLPKAASRGRLCELLASEIGADFGEANVGDTAFMIGAFSLLDVLLNMRMDDILQHLPLPAVAQTALGSRSGVMGSLLNLLDASDRRDTAKAGEIFAELPLSTDTFFNAQLDALSWAAKIHPS